MASAYKGLARIQDPGKLTSEDLAGLMDHTNLKAFTTAPQIVKLCEEAAQWGFGAVCVNPANVRLAAKTLAGTRVAVCAVVGFPLGANRPSTKAFEAGAAVEDGAREIDMVANVGALRGGESERVLEDIKAVTAASGGMLVKVILETCYLTDEQIVEACELSAEAGADFVKTSTGFGAFGAHERHVRLMRRTVGDKMGVKASGGIQDCLEAMRMIRAGASRLGVSASIQIIEGYKKLGSDKSLLDLEMTCAACPCREANISKLPKELHLYYKAACNECPHKGT